MSGWIKLHRSLQDSAIASHPEYLAVWVHLMLRAQHSASEFVVGRQIVKLSAGQLVFGRIKFSSEIGVSENKVRAALDVMKSLNMITIKSMAKFSIISITKWQEYQTESPANNQETAGIAPASNQHPATYKNDKNDKNDKNVNNEKNILTENKFSDEDKKCADWLLGKLQESIPDCKKPNINGWAEHVRKMRELDNRDHKEICQLWAWCRKDSFEAANVQSPEKLRKRYDQLKTKMKSPAVGGSHAGQPKPSLIDRFIATNYGSGAQNDYGSMGGDDSVIRGEVVEPVRGDAGRIGAMAADIIGDFKATGGGCTG